MLFSATVRKGGHTMIDLYVELKLDIEALEALRDEPPGALPRSEDA